MSTRTPNQLPVLPEGSPRNMTLCHKGLFYAFQSATTDNADIARGYFDALVGHELYCRKYNGLIDDLDFESFLANMKETIAYAKAIIGALMMESAKEEETLIEFPELGIYIVTVPLSKLLNNTSHPSVDRRN
jgi:hypothetical protein